MENILRVILVIERISRAQYPGKKTLQKIAYGMSHRVHTTEIAPFLLSEGKDEKKEVFSGEEEEILEEVVATFGHWNGYDLELIATTDYVAGQMFPDGRVINRDELIAGVRRIKGQKFSPQKVEEAVENLKSMGLLRDAGETTKRE